MNRYIGAELRRLVANRADYVCEYCLIHEDDTFLGCEADHIISLKHGGTTESDNLAYACVFCNRHKGSDIGSLVTENDMFVRFYNPRKDKWNLHFQLDGAFIRPISDIGKATSRILDFNTDERIMERESLIAKERYPSSEALKVIGKL
jgi:hypothetical protein